MILMPSNLSWAITGLLLTGRAAAQTFSNTSTAVSVNSTTTCTYSPADCTAISSVRACEKSYTDYLTSSWSWIATVPYSTSSLVSTSIFTDVVWVGNYTGQLSTFCDGVPRGGKAPALTTSSTFSLYSSSFSPAYPSPAPSCTYDYRGCALLISEFRASTRAATAESPRNPVCAGDTAECITPEGALCPMDAGDVKLMYWPQSKDPSDLCANGTTASVALSITPSPTVPYTTVLGDFTLTSPTVYLSFNNLNGLPCYKSWKNAVVPITNLADLSSVSFTEGSGIGSTLPINWNDLNSPVPLSAYKGQQYCWSAWAGERYPYDKCSTIYDDYLPWLALPTNPSVYTGMDARFQNCTAVRWRKFVFDPPLALTSARGLVPGSSTAAPPPPTATSQDQDSPPITEPASPAPEPESPTVTATTRPAPPQPTEDPGDPSTTAGGDGGLGPVISMIASSLAATAGSPPGDGGAIPANGNTMPSNGAITIPVDPPDPSDPSDPSDPGATNAGGGGIVASPDPSNPGGVVISGPSAGALTLLPGETGVVGGGVVASMPSSGGAVVVGGTRTYAVPGLATGAGDGSSGGGAGVGGADGSGAVISGGAVVVTAVPEAQSGAAGASGGSVVVVAGTTLTPGGDQLSISGVGFVSAATNEIVVDGVSTVRFSALPTVGGGSAAVVTLGGDLETISAPETGGGLTGVVVVDGITLTIGGAPATIGSGEVVSAAGVGIVVDGTMVSYESAAGVTSTSFSGAQTTPSTVVSGTSSKSSETSSGESIPTNNSTSGADALSESGRQQMVLLAGLLAVSILMYLVY